MIKSLKEWPLRYTVAMMTGLGNLLAVQTRVCLNIAIVAMVNQTSFTNRTADTDSGECPAYDGGSETSIPDISQSGEYLWGPYTQGIVLASFFYGSLCTQIFGGLLSGKFGGKYIIGGGVFVSGLLSCIIPLIADYGAIYVIIVRVSQGLAQGIIHPGMYTLIVMWAPKPERGTLSAFMLLGGMAGAGVGAMLTGYFATLNFLGGWPIMFYLNGIVCSLWMLAWMYLVHSSPEEHPRITLEELFHIKNLQRSESLANIRIKLGIPWFAMLTSLPFWSLLLVRFAHYWGLYTSQTALPLYMSSAINFPIDKNGAVNGVSFILASAGVVFGGISDYMKRNTNFSLTCIRKLFTSLAYLGAAVSFGLIPLARCNTIAVSALLIFAQIFLSCSAGGDSIIMMDMAPRYAGTVYGIVATLADTAGFFNPMYTGFITQNDVSINQWSYVFYTAVAIFVFCWLVFAIFGSADIQPWAQVEEEDNTDIVASFMRRTSYGSITNSQKEGSATFY